MESGVDDGGVIAGRQIVEAVNRLIGDPVDDVAQVDVAERAFGGVVDDLEIAVVGMAGQP